MPPQLHNSSQSPFSTRLLCLLLLLTPACGDEEKDNENDSSTQVYLSSTYGYAVSFDRETEVALGYAVVEGTCWAQPVPSEVWWAASRDEEKMDFDYLGQKQPGIPFLRVDDLDEACPKGVLPTALDEGTVPDWEQEFALFQKTFKSQYAFFELRGVDWDEQVKAAKKKLSQDMSLEEFFSVLSESVAPLGDGHVVIQAGEELVFSESARPDIYTSLSQEAAEQVDEDTEDPDAFVEDYVTAELSKIQGAIEALMMEGSEHGNFDDPIFWSQLDWNENKYSYLRLTSFSELVVSEDFPIVEDSIQALHTTLDEVLLSNSSNQGLIIDVRVNDGGWDHLGRELVSRFVAKETHLYSKRVYSEGVWGEKSRLMATPHSDTPYTRPIVVLAGPSTVSAAETFVMAMRELDQVLVVGEATNGITSDSTPKFLPSGIYFSLANEEYSSPDGQVFEKAGVAPDIETPVFTQEDRSENRDSALLRALSELADR